MESILAFYDKNTEVCIALIAAAVIFLVLKPKEFGKGLVVIAIVSSIGYMIIAVIDFVDDSSKKKSDVSSRTDRSYQDSDSSQ